MKASKKRPACLNCGRPLLQSDNYCPNCGQLNTSHKLGFKTLLDDFFSNYISFDSKLARSTVPFLFKPGFLTNRFNEGKRISFVHPLRLYFIISFIFFFLLALLTSSIMEENKFSLKKMLSGNTTVNTKRQQMHPPGDSQSAPLTATGDTLQAPAPSEQAVNRPAENPIVVEDESENRVLRVMRNDSLTDAQVLDSLNMDKNSLFGSTIVHQGRKVLQKDIDVFIPYLIKNLSLMMFLMLPVFALFLYILFRRREPFYISHVIHALHLHAFSFLLLSLVVLAELFDNSGNLLFLAFIIISLYAFISVKRVYGQGWLRTFLKFNLLGFLYFTTLNLALMLEVGISFMLF